jgi:integrase
MRQKMIILPKVYDAGGDLGKPWFVFFSVRDSRTGKMTRFRRSDDLNKIQTKKARQERAKELQEEYSLRLKNGWTPFDDEIEVIYEDHLQFKSLTDIYSTKRKSNRTLEFYINNYVEHIKGNLSISSLQTYVSKLRTFNAFINSKGISDNDISTIENSVILDFFDFIINKRKLSGVSVGKYRQILLSLFDYISDKGAIKINPVFKIPKCNRLNDSAARPVYRNDIDVFKKAIEKSDPQLWLAIEFEFYCYLRPGLELRLLRVGDIDFARGLIHINKENFKTRRDNIKEIPEEFLLKLRNHYKLLSYPREYYVIGANGEPGDKPLGKNNLRHRFNVIRDSLNMPKEYKLYSWKHTGGVLASEAGIPVKDISDQMGHTTLTTTSIYLKAKGGRRIMSIRNNYPTL